jgi:hypothetical protein
MRRKEMPVIIPSELANYAKSITLDVDFNLFTDRQIKNVVKQLRTGCISRGNSMTSHIARWIKKQDTSGIPYSYFLYDSYEFKWRGLPNGHPFFEAVKQAAAIKKISETEPSKWWMDALDDMFRIADEQKPKGSVSAYRLGEFKKTVKKTMKIEQKLSPIMEEFISKLENKQLGVMPIQVSEIKSWE